jgi:hypothetical protein
MGIDHGKGVSNMSINYPIFLRDKASYMFLSSSQDDINYQLEQVDVEYKEYEGWDVEGRPIELFLENDKIIPKYVSEDYELDELREVILQFAKVSSNEPFEIEVTDRNPFELFKAAQDHIKLHGKGLVKNIKKLFKKK